MTPGETVVVKSVHGGGGMNTVADSALSYGVAAIGVLVSLAEDAQALTLIVSFLVLVLRLIYDAVRLYRYLTKKKDGDEQ